MVSIKDILDYADSRLQGELIPIFGALRVTINVFRAVQSAQLNLRLLLTLFHQVFLEADDLRKLTSRVLFFFFDDVPVMYVEQERAVHLYPNLHNFPKRVDD